MGLRNFIAPTEQAKHARFNWTVLISWLCFSGFLLSQPWLSNWSNNRWHNYTADYEAPDENGQMVNYPRSGLCTTPAAEMRCTDGQNFTELALQYRGVAFGCGCGQGYLGEGLCPITSYGYTLSDYVSTAPALGAMWGLSFFPMLGAWKNSFFVNDESGANYAVQFLHNGSMFMFQLFFIIWGICSDCTFPRAHAVFTVLFIGSLGFHWVINGVICVYFWGFKTGEARTIFAVALFSGFVMTLGSVPRIFLMLNSIRPDMGLPNLNKGLGSYAFWLGEALSLSFTFGAFPLICLHHSLIGATDLPQLTLKFDTWVADETSDDDDSEQCN